MFLATKGKSVGLLRNFAFPRVRAVRGDQVIMMNVLKMGYVLLLNTREAFHGIRSTRKFFDAAFCG